MDTKLVCLFGKRVWIVKIRKARGVLLSQLVASETDQEKTWEDGKIMPVNKPNDGGPSRRGCLPSMMLTLTRQVIVRIVPSDIRRAAASECRATVRIAVGAYIES